MAGSPRTRPPSTSSPLGPLIVMARIVIAVVGVLVWGGDAADLDRGQHIAVRVAIPVPPLMPRPSSGWTYSGSSGVRMDGRHLQQTSSLLVRGGTGTRTSRPARRAS